MQTNLLGIARSSIGNFRNFSGGLIHPDDAGTLWRPLRGPQGLQAQCRRNTAFGAGRRMDLVRMQEMRPINGNKDIVIGKVIDISGRKAKEMNLLSLSCTDALTGLMNREAFVGKS